MMPSQSVERLTGRTVTAFMRANHIDPDLAAGFQPDLDGRPEPSDGVRERALLVEA
jgi:hypothetical protein